MIAFKTLKNDLCNAGLSSIQDGVPFEVETDASDFVLAAVLSLDGRPVAFVSRTLSACEKRYSAVEKEALAIIEAVCKSRYIKPFLENGRFIYVSLNSFVISRFANSQEFARLDITKHLPQFFNLHAR